MKSHAVLAFWRKHWLEAGVLASSGLAFVLGYIGFERALPAAGQTPSQLDILYLTIQLFFLKSGIVPGPLPWELEIARFLAPLAIAGTILEIFYKTVQEVLLRLTRDHIVVCGLGRKGLQLVKEFQGHGDVVVAIEKDEQNDAVRICRALGVVVLVGDATDKALLQRARVHCAKHVIAICRDDAANLEIALHTLQLTKEKRTSLTTKIGCYTHVVNLHLHESLRQQSLFADQNDPVDVRVFNNYADSARQVLNDYPLERGGTSSTDSRVVHLVVLGFERMGQSVALQAAKVGHYANGKRLRITVIDGQVERQKKEFLRRYPQFGAVCDAEYLALDADDCEALERIHEAAHNQNSSMTVAVCLEDDSCCFTCAMNVLPRLRRTDVPVLVNMMEQGGLVELLRDIPGVRPFGMTNLTCTGDLLLHENLDKVAIAVHEQYREQQRERKPNTDTAMQPWQLLDPVLQDSNRQQADHIPIKLRAIGCMSARLPTESKSVPLKEFSPDEVELLARMEHARWNAERFLGGWTLGPRDPDNRTSPYLVPWDDLDDDIREYDREAVRNIFCLLETIGEKIYRSA